MPENDQTTDHDDYTNPQPDPEWQPFINMVGSAAIGLCVLYGLCSGLQKEIFWQVFIGASVNWFILLAMFFQASITQKQWVAMQNALTASFRQAEAAEEQLKLTEDTFYMGQRAYVAITNMQLEAGLLMNNHPNPFVVKGKNGGQTPAFNLIISGAFRCDSRSLEEIKPLLKAGFLDNETMPIFCVGGEPIPRTVITHDQILSDGEFEGWAKDKTFIYAAVEICYDDIRGNHHQLTYWYQFFKHRNFVLVEPVVLNVYKPKKADKNGQNPNPGALRPN